MDTRTALVKGSRLNFGNQAKEYTIQNELGRGGSCIVYNAVYTNNSGVEKKVRIKECYPFKLSITREADGSLTLKDHDQAAFAECKKQMWDAFDVCNELFNSEGSTNLTSNTIDIYQANNTLYIVTAWLEGKTLANVRLENVREAVRIVKSVAIAIQKIHDKGYLFLDIKPDNIFILDGTTEIVQLFDFDTLFPFAATRGQTAGQNYRISYTRGFAAYEQRHGDIKSLGPHTDVYALGALLFYLIFGYPPAGHDCDYYARFDFDKSKLCQAEYQDKLFIELSEFFHNTLANHFPARYQDMQEVIQQLDQIAKYADETVPFIISTDIIRPQFLLGRESELQKLDEWFTQDQSRCIFVHGMGGIGKSTLIREFIASRRQCFDNVLYLYFKGSIQALINDDEQLHVNTLQKDKRESSEEYFQRKLRCLRELTQDTKTLLVIDNFNAEIGPDLISLMNVGWRIILVSRHKPASGNYPALSLPAISDRQTRHRFFELYAQKPIAESECCFLDKIIDKIEGHSLVMELIARQTAKSYLSLSEVSTLLDQVGFARLAPEKVNYEKDLLTGSDTIRNIISAIFTAENQTLEKKTLLKMLSLFDLSGIPLDLFCELLKLPSKDDINDLLEEGWINIDGTVLSLHPVIQEVINLWDWNAEYKNTAADVMKSLLAQSQSEEAITPQFLQAAESLLEGCKDVPALRKKRSFINLLYTTVHNMPREREEYILSKGKELLAAKSGLPRQSVILLYTKLVDIYGERKDFASARALIKQAGSFLHQDDSQHTKALYHEMLAGFYDCLLDGAYYSDDEHNSYFLLLEELDKAIENITKSNQANRDELLTKYLLSKANVLIRGYDQDCDDADELWKLLDMAKVLCKRTYPLESKMWRDFCLVEAWYFTIVRQSQEDAMDSINQACAAYHKADKADLDKIDEFLVPCANMFYELGDYSRSLEWLNQAVLICDAYSELAVYQRKKLELQEHIQEVLELKNSSSSCEN